MYIFDNVCAIINHVSILRRVDNTRLQNIQNHNPVKTCIKRSPLVPNKTGLKEKGQVTF